VIGLKDLALTISEIVIDILLLASILLRLNNII
jgi:hypothetical protein